VKSRYSNIVVLICAILSFAPIVSVDILLDAFVRGNEQRHLQSHAEATALQLNGAIADAAAALIRIVDTSPSACTPTFVENASREIERSLSLRDVVVETRDGVQYCAVRTQQLGYSRLSDPLSLPGQREVVDVVQLGRMPVPFLRVSLPFVGSRSIAAFVPALPQTPESLLPAMPSGTMLRIGLTSGLTIASAGAVESFDARAQRSDWVTTESFVGGLPIRIEVAAPFAALRAGYADLDLTLTLVACLFSATLLLAALGYVRRTKVPSFDLERAIAQGEIKPFYQPIINLRTGALMGCEMLCRWERKNGRMVPPGQFIDYAETTGLAIPMTLSLMEQVKNDLGALCQAQPGLKISINLFDGHFQDGAIVEDVQAIFGGSQIRYEQLVFEITERRPLESSMQTHAVISGLHALGAKLALDDTGTGHSSLAYLATLGVDVIKIDRIFVDMIKPEVEYVPVLDGLIAMARDLGTEIVAEGVETEQQALYLRARGVYQAQGFLFAPALRPSAFIELANALASIGPKLRPALEPLGHAA
jgi:EAL domain-containing protein (putative c-di-GMP-specific phosphodiesterase class I)